MFIDIAKQVSIACDENGKLKSPVKWFAFAFDLFVTLALFLFLLQWVFDRSGMTAWGGSGEGFANDFQRMYAGGPSVLHMARRTDPGAETPGYRSPQQPSFDESIAAAGAAAGAAAPAVGQASFTDADLHASMYGKSD